MINRIEQKFSDLKVSGKKAFIAFITAGYPDLETTEKLVLEFCRSGVDIVELGVPFSDPIADGVVIQESSLEALKKKVTLSDILKLVRRLRKACEIPICLMTYYNPVFCFGEDRFVCEAKCSGVDGIIIPDLLPEDGRQLMQLTSKAGIDSIFFLSPTSSKARMKFVSSLSKGFIYYVSLTGTTGERKHLALDIKDKIKQIKRFTKKPVCVGFGISTRSQVRQAARFCDGVIVGSAIVKKIKENIERPHLEKIVAKFVRSLTNV